MSKLTDIEAMAEALVGQQVDTFNLLKDADADLTYWEGIAIKREFSVASLDMYEKPDEYAFALVWAIQCRTDKTKALDIKGWRKAEVYAFLKERYGDFSADDPGKSSENEPTATLPVGASSRDSSRERTST
jgi:hypothetical protein